MKMWKENKLDIIIGTGFGSQAQIHTFSKDINLTAAYTFIYNSLELPSGCVPITRVREDE
jgi:hypothetical protein